MTRQGGGQMSGGGPIKTRGAGPISLFARHPTAANLLMLAMLLVGGAALLKLNTQFFPDFAIDVIQVEVTWPGASAEDVDSNIVQAIEPELRFLDGVDNVSAFAFESFALIFIEYVPGADMQSALAQVESAVDQVSTLPETAETPDVRRIFAYETIAKIVLSGPFSQDALQAFARRMRSDLLGRGVDKVDIDGLRRPEIWIEPEPETLRRLDLTLADLADAVAAASEDSPLGDLAGGDRRFRALGQGRAPEDFEKMVVRAFPDGRKITIADVATVRAAWEDGETVMRRKGEPAVQLHVQRSSSADALTVQEIVAGYLSETRPTLPPTLTVEVHAIAADLIRQRIDLLLYNAVGGLLLVVGVLVLFLNIRVAFWVAAGIPVALAATFGVMYAQGQSINMLSLFGLIMALGVIVDDAIVVGEHAEALRAAGADPETAAIAGAQRMAAPVFSASLTSICAFLPLLIIGGIIGVIIAAIPLVIVCVLIASLIECFLVLPGHMRLALKGTGGSGGPIGRFRAGFDRRFNAFRDGGFRRSVIWATDNRYATLAGALALLMLAMGLVAGGRVGFHFFPTAESDTAFANIEMAAGTPRAETVAMIDELERALTATVRALEGPDSDLVAMSIATIGAAIGGDGPSADRSTDTSAGLRVELRTADQRAIRMDDFLALWRAEVQPRAGLETLTIRAAVGGPPGRDVDVRIAGGEPDILKAAAEEVKALLRSYPGVREISDTLPYGKPETILELTPRGRALGFDLRDVSAQLRGALEGEIAERFPRGEEEVTVRVRQPAEQLNAAAIEDLFLRAPGGAETPLDDVVARSERAGFSQIQRESGLREVAIQADVDPAVTTTQETTDRLEADGLAAIAQKYGLRYRFRGKSEEMAETFADMQFGAVLGLAGIYIVLAWVFASYVRPLAVIAIIPLGFIGAIFGHLIMGYDLTILSIIGVIGLSGIVVNDSIVLVTTIDERMKRERANSAVVGGACDRLRAVLLTSLTTIGGLTPLMFETSLQAQFLIPMALTFVFGLMGATLLILYVAPAIALIQHDVGAGFRRLRGGESAVSPAAAAGE